MRLALSIACLVTLATAQTPPKPAGETAPAPRLDGSTTASFERTLGDIRRALPDEERQNLDATLQYLADSARGLEQRLMGSRPSTERLQRVMRARLHGLTAAEILRTTARMPRGWPVQRRRANESAIIATLRNIAAAQARVQAHAAIDVNGNGAGEYAFLAELAATTILRGASHRLDPPLLPTALGRARGGIVRHCGYLIRVYLADGEGQPIAESGSGGAGEAEPDATHSEIVWCCYAWPLQFGVTGNRAFFINQDGDVLVTDNRGNTHYSAYENGPPPFAAFTETTSSLLDEAAANGTGCDGRTWTRLD